MDIVYNFGVPGFFAAGLYIAFRFSLQKSQEVRDFFCGHWWLHPNWICVWRVPMALFGLWLYFSLGHLLWGVLIFTVAAVLDGVDGLVARACGLVSEFGKEFDPLCDKATYLPAIGVFSYRGDISLGLTITLCIIEVFGQFCARPLLKWLGLSVAANKIGKVKAVFCFALIIYLAILDSSKLEGGHILADYWLWACVFLALGSIGLKFVSAKYLQKS